jgi:catechol 2,3-dioxygenase-like lactoylglutathione lyase family enzyme
VYSSQGTAPQPPAPGLLFRPIVQVADVAVALAFFEHLGAELIHGGPDADYVLMQLGTVQIGLVGCQGETGPGAVELNFSAALPLDELERRLRRRRVAIARGVHPTVFGPQLHVRAPDGLLIKIGQLEPDDYL